MDTIRRHNMLSGHNMISGHNTLRAHEKRSGHTDTLRAHGHAQGTRTRSGDTVTARNGHGTERSRHGRNTQIFKLVIITVLCKIIFIFDKMINIMVKSFNNLNFVFIYKIKNLIKLQIYKRH